jgi:hypothetical protein
VVAEIRERLIVITLALQQFDIERFNVKKLNNMEIKGQNQVNISEQVFEN